MDNTKKFFIDGQWVDPAGSETLDVVNPATETPIATIALGDARDVDRAVLAARKAFDAYALTSVDDRVALLAEVIEVYKSRSGDLAKAVTEEMGAPVGLAEQAQVPAGLGQIVVTMEALQTFTSPSASVPSSPRGTGPSSKSRPRSPRRWHPAARWY
jgi:aldehyde dehydrogenase (NAD+)